MERERWKEWQGLITAFNCLDRENNGYITFDTWSELMEVMRPRSSRSERKFLFNALDRDRKDRLDVLDFLDMREMSQLEVTALQPPDESSIRFVIARRWLWLTRAHFGNAGHVPRRSRRR